MIEIDIEHNILTSEGNRLLKIKETFPENNLIGVLGPSGSGKTTFLRILAGLIRPDRGFIQVGDTVFFDSSRNITISPQQRNVGFMFQDYALFPNMSVEENIAFALSETEDRQWLIKIMETFGLETLRKQKPDQLSGGQKQRVALARALARKAKILLLDEPLSAIDQKMRIELQNEIVKAHQLSGSTTFIVSHDENEIKKLASIILYIT